jgi:hypothetical protein
LLPDLGDTDSIELKMIAEKQGPNSEHNMENIKITAIEEELRNYQIVSNGGIVNGVKLGTMGMIQPWFRDEIFRCKKLLYKKPPKKQTVESK